MQYTSLEALKVIVEDCRLCKRLVRYRETVEPKPQYKDQSYWRRPVAGFGDPDSYLFILGLAPAAHGGNRTGRVFTGDESGNFLIKLLYKAGYANQDTSLSRDDGLVFTHCYLTAAVKCAPPLNKPTQKECDTCSQYWHNELRLLKKVTSVLVLGKFAFDAFCSYAKLQGHCTKNVHFKHGAIYPFPGLATLYVSYHPSPRNTNTGKLTAEMFLDLLDLIQNSRY